MLSKNNIILPIITGILSIVLLCLSLQNGNFETKSFVLWIISLISLCFLSKKIDGQTNPISVPPTVYVLILISSVFRLFYLTNPEYVYFHGDEAIISKNAQTSFEKGLTNFNWNFLGSESSTLNQLPSLWYIINGLIIKTIGPSLVSIKLLSLIADMFLSILIYLIVKAVNRHLAPIALLVYLTTPIAIHFSLTGYQNIHSTLFLFLGFFCLLRSRPILSGIAIGLSFYFYLSAIINPLIIISFLILSRSSFVDKIKSITIFSISLLITLIPYIFYNFSQYNFILGRSDAMVFPSNPGYFLRQVQQFSQAFVPTGLSNGSGLFYPDLPIIPHWSFFLFFVVGAIYLVKSRSAVTIFLILVLIVTSVTGGLLTDNPPATQRIINLFPAIVLTTVFGLHRLFGHNSKLLNTFTAIFLFLNLFSFLTKNIPTYYRYRNLDVIESIKTIKSGNLIVSAPFHKNDQIYFLSFGKISALPFYCPPKSEWILYEVNNPPNFSECPSQKIYSINQWSTVFDQSILAKISPAN